VQLYSARQKDSSRSHLLQVICAHSLTPGITSDLHQATRSRSDLRVASCGESGDVDKLSPNSDGRCTRGEEIGGVVE
jgi:hypothetical protein